MSNSTDDICWRCDSDREQPVKDAFRAGYLVGKGQAVEYAESVQGEGFVAKRKPTDEQIDKAYISWARHQK